MIKVSVIVPVYNVESYLHECLDSLINQTLKDIEIICVDDCSTDNSYSILEEYSKKDIRFKIIKNNYNSGAGYTRNVGIKLALGEYIGFIDSDDYISKDYFENLYNTAKEYDSDVVNTLDIYNNVNGEVSFLCYNIRCLMKSDNFLNKLDNIKYAIDNTCLIKYITNPSKYYISYSTWNKIYRRKFLLDNNLFFINGSHSEDANFILRLIINNPKVSFNNKSQYYYRSREKSSMQISRLDLENKINSIENMENVINYCKNIDSYFLYSSVFMIKVWHPPLYLFSISYSINKEEFYPYLYNFANKFYLEYDDYFTFDDKKDYEEYILIRGSKTYNDYLINKYNLTINKSICTKLDYIIGSSRNNIFKIFDIRRENNYLFITILGIKITIKNKNI